MRNKVRLVLGLIAMTVVLAACAQNASQDSLKPAGPYAEKIHALFTPVFWIAAAIFFIVEGGIVFLLIRYRHRKGRAGIPPQIHGNNRLEIAWTILPALILVGVAVPTVSTIWDLSKQPRGDVLNVTVKGHQWWWEFDYPDLNVSTANELHIPTGRPVYVSLDSVGGLIGDGEVIHSFWVPELAGKQDVVPARTNHVTLEADRPGTYYGQCAEFCGLSHANMRLRVIAQSPADFDAWVSAQQQDAVTPQAGSVAAAGMDFFFGTNGLGGQCIACHAIQGTKASAIAAPNLTHFASRDCFAGCMFSNTSEQVAAWLRNPPARKPGSWMPNFHLSEEQINALVTYLESLK